MNHVTGPDMLHTSATLVPNAPCCSFTEGDEKLDPLIMEWRMMEAMSKQVRRLVAVLHGEQRFALCPFG